MTLDTGLSFSIFGKKTCVMGGQSAPPQERHFAQCAEHGIRQVELIIMEGYLTPGDTATVETVRRLAQQYGVTVNSVHGPSGFPTNGHWLGDPDEEARKRNVAERILALEGTQALGARYMVVEFEAYGQWPFWPHEQVPEAVYPQAAEQWRKSFDELLPIAGRLGVTLAVENIDGLSNESLPALMAGLTRKEAGICFDSSHASYGGHWQAELDRLAPYIIGTHLSDNDGLAGAAWVDRHWRPFEGPIDWPRLVHTIATRSPCPCLILEVLNRDNPQITPELMAAYRKIKSLLPTP